MAGVIKEAQQFRNTQIGVVKASRGAVKTAQTAGAIAENLTSMAVKEAAIKAKQDGTSLGMAMSNEDLTTIDAETGLPVAMTKQPSGYGRIAANAFQDTVNTQFEFSIKSEIQAMAQRTAILHPDDPDKYDNVFTNNLDAIKQNAKGRYKNIIDRVGGVYLASTKLNIQGKQVQKAHEVTKANVSEITTKASEEILTMFGSTAKNLDAINLYATEAREIVNTAKTAGSINQSEYIKQIAKIDNALIKGSISRQMLGNTNTAVNGIDNLRNLSMYLQSPNVTTLAKFDSTDLIIPERNVDGKILPAMTMKDYALYISKRMKDTAFPDEVRAWFTRSVDSKITAKNAETKVSNNLTNQNKQLISNSVQKKADKIFNPSRVLLNDTGFEATDTINRWSKILDSVVEDANISHKFTQKGPDGKNASMDAVEYQKIYNGNIKKVAEKTISIVLNKTQGRQRDLKASVIKSLSEGGAFGSGTLYESLTKKQKLGLTESEFSFISKTHRSLDRIHESSVDFKKEFTAVISGVRSATATVQIVTDKIENEQLKNDRAVAKIKLFKMNDEAHLYTDKSKNIDLVNNSGALANGVAEIAKTFDDMFKEIELNKSKSIYNLEDVKNARDKAIAFYIAGAFQSVTDNVKTEYTFTEGGKEVKRALTKNDIDKISVALQNGSVSSEHVPKEFIPLTEEVAKAKLGIEQAVVVSLFESIKTNFNTETNKVSQAAKVQQATIDIASRNNVTNDEINKVINDNIWGDTPASDRDPLWFQYTPFQMDDGTVDPKWTNALSMMRMHGRLPEGVVSMINALGNGNLPMPTPTMKPEDKARLLSTHENAIKLFQVLSNYKVNIGGSEETSNFTRDGALTGYEFDKKAVGRINNVLDIQRMRVGGDTTTSVMAKLTQANDPVARKGFQDAFKSELDYYNANDNSADFKPKNVNDLLRLVTSNVFQINLMKAWANEEIATGSIKNVDEFIKKATVEHSKLVVETDIVFEMPTQGGEFKDNKFYATSGLKKLGITENTMEKFVIPNIQNILPDGYYVTLGVNKTLVDAVTIGDQSGNNGAPFYAQSTGVGGGNFSVVKGNDADADVYGNTPVYLMPATDDINNKTYNVVTLKRVGDQLEVGLVQGANGPIQWTPTNDMINNTMFDEEKTLEILDGKRDENLRKIKLLKAQPTTAKVTQAITELQANNEKVLAEKNALTQPSEVPNKNNSFMPSENTDVIANASELIFKQEGHSNGRYKDGKSFSIGAGFYQPSLTAKELAVFKNPNYVTEAESKIVLKMKITDIRNSWKNLTKGGNWENLPTKSRVALISMAYQLGINNLVNNRKNAGWPKFMESIREASKQPLNSNKQREALKNAAKHMLHNYDKDDNITTKTKWHSQTTNRANAMSIAIGGN